MFFNKIESNLKELNCFVSTKIKSISPSFFSKDNFLEHQKKTQNKDYIVFSLCALDDEKIISQIIFSKQNNVEHYNYFSPITGAFSDFYLVKERIALKKIEFFISYIESYLFDNVECNKVVYKFPPELYSSDNNIFLLNAMFNSGWQISNIDLNYHLNLFDENDFRKNLSSSKRRELNRVSREETHFTKAEEQGDIKKAYDVIKANRESQGYPMTMKWDDLYALYVAMPDDVLFYNLKMNDSIIASAVCLKVNCDQMYVFYWGENPEFRKLSPVVKLAEKLYSALLQEGFKTLDIGISTENSVINQGLIDFKTNIGCKLTKKITIQKYLDKAHES